MKRKVISLRFTTLLWSVAEAGYEIRPSDERFLFKHDDPQRYLSARFGDQNETTPLEDNAALYREFAKLQLTEQAVLGFADRYGLLSWPSQPSGENVYAEDEQREPLSVWFTAIKNMKEAVKVWRAVSTPDYPVLSRLVSALTTDEGLAFDGPSSVMETVFNRRSLSIDELEVPSQSNLIGSAQTVYMHLVNNIINRNLEPLSPRLRWDSFGGEAPVLVTPKTLLSGLWMQLAAEVAEVGVGDYKQCERCGKWMNARLGRSDKRTCSEVCKKALRRLEKRNSL